MRIKRLEIQGFKSFKDKTVIYFDRPITGIVGPNGSGKSNIVDAFFWVMGEQSYKHIRSSGSDDIIFKGSSKYQALGMAEATLVMEQDYVDSENAPMGATTADTPDNPLTVKMKKREISVTRRVYRSGEGEYFINGVQARLKDIQELFLDTGVGAKGYSVIEQGQIDKVVNSKPEDRRLLIEDAAGIAKYKARKKESLRKLEGANANLLRLNDVLTEMDRSLSSLERQAQKARKYKEYRADLLERETQWGRRKSQVIHRQLKKIQGDREGLDQLLVGLKAELSQCETDLESGRVVQLHDSKISEELQSEVERFSSELTHHQSALELSKKRQEDLSRQLVQLSAEKGQIESDQEAHQESLSSKTSELEGLDEKCSELTLTVGELNAKLVEIREIHSATQKEAELKRRELVSLTQNSSQSYSKIAALEERVQGANSQLALMIEQEESLKKQLENTTLESSEISESLSTKIEARKAARENLQIKREECTQLEAQLKQSRIARDLAMRTLSSVSSRLKSLEELESAREGMANGPKKVLEWGIEKGHPFAVLSDFIDVDPGYDTAVEAVLGHAFERLYTENSEAAFAALQFLRDHNEGSASIQIAISNLDSEVRAHYNPLRKYIKLIAPATYTPTGSKTVHSLIEALVSSVEVLEEVPAMSDIKTYQQEGISFVTKNGIWFDARQGVLYGGSSDSGLAGSILSRKRTIQTLSEEVEQAEANQFNIEESLSKTSAALELAQADSKTFAQALNDLEIEVGALEKEKIQVERKKVETEQTVARLEQQKNSLQVTVASAQKEATELEEGLIGIATKQKELESWTLEHETGVSDKESLLHHAAEELQLARIQEASERERKNSLKKELDTEMRYLQDRNRRLSEVNQLLETFGQNHEEYSEGDHEHSESILSLTRSLSEKREALSIIRNRLEGENAQVNARMERIRELHKLGDEKSKVLTQFSIDLERLQGELNYLTQNMEEKYGVGCLGSTEELPIQDEMTDPVVTLEMSEDGEKALHAEVEELREKIRRIGEVNTMAVEEYEEMQKRHEYLFKEKHDLEASMQNLNEAIEHINKTSEDRFKKAFEAIASRFEKLFPIIFGGGQAQLTLVYPEGSTDILEAGVDILAQPPGKKISNMALLSGGEKALTAISMIFAIFMVKPSPFCILDEVDAPLDDSNIGKFNALVREMSAKSQFILVTHNKKTMELNDTLYGVTMEEPGVSRMVSIQLQ